MFFYARVEANIPARLSYVNWTLRMSGHMLCGGLVDPAPGQSKDVGKRPIQVLRAGALLIIAAANLVGRGTAS